MYVQNWWPKIVCLMVVGQAIVSCTGNLHAADLFHPASHPHAGLPLSSNPQAIYDPDLKHPLNKLHNLLFVRVVSPAEIQSQLPDERAADIRSDQEYFVKGWYFEKREGKPEDTKAFGGDVRFSPIQNYTPEQTEQLIELLQSLQTPEDIAQYPALKSPLNRLMLQWDVMSVWWSLERAKYSDEKLLTELCRTIRALAQPAAVLETLPSGLSNLHRSFDGTPSTKWNPATKRDQAFLPADFPPAADDRSSNWVEIGRRSSVLFKAERSLKATKVYLHTTNRDQSLALIEQANDRTQKSADFHFPDGTMTGFVQTLAGIDDQLQPVITPVVDELRVRVLSPPYELSSTNNTSSHDGSSHWIYLRTRQCTISAPYSTVHPASFAALDGPHDLTLDPVALGIPEFRFVSDQNQALFLEYGSLKHATYSAQCALCHRLSNNGDQAPGGIRSLSNFAQPHEAKPDERDRIATVEMGLVTRVLRARLQIAESPTVRKTRPEKSPEERAALANKLREIYSQPAEFWPAPNLDESAKFTEIGLLPAVQHPQDNPSSKAKVSLGQILFFDPRLSGTSQMACASCHDPDLGWSDGRTASFGHSRKHLARNAPTIRNTAYYDKFFWDGRATSLEDQALMVLTNPDEMHADTENVVSVLSKEPEYQKLFSDAFGSEGIDTDRICKALACFERSIVGGSSRFDAFLRGQPKALSDEQILGLDLFRRDARCINCHNGPLFSDSQFHEVGLSYYGRTLQDLGRGQHTHDDHHSGQFRTPSLRDVTNTTPLMHNGLFELPGTLRMYNAGMPTLRRKESQKDDVRFPIKSVLLKPLHLNQQDLEDLAEFIEALEEPKRRVFPPIIPGMKDISHKLSVSIQGPKEKFTDESTDTPPVNNTPE
jgi:cytochrome c peroxidase